ncbi:MAG: FMN-binding glutamate synthase family protein, partial [Burkholderiaceae bacterium]
MWNWVRYTPWLSTAPLAVALSFYSPWLGLLFAVLFGLGLQDVTQTARAVRRNYPLTGRLR